METFIAASVTVTGTEGLDGVTVGDDKLSDFSKGHNDLWNFDDED